MKWITRERPKIDRIACPWLVTRFIDQEPEFLYVHSGDVLSKAADDPRLVTDSITHLRRYLELLLATGENERGERDS